MKILLFILLLITNNLYSQVTITHQGSSGPTTSSSNVCISSSINFQADSTYIFVVMATNATNEGEITVSSQTWESVISYGDATMRIHVFKTVASTTVTESVTYGNFGSSRNGMATSIYRVSNSSGDMTNTNTGTATSTDMTVALSPLRNNRGAVMMFGMTNGNPPTLTPEAGWTERLDAGYDTPTTGIYEMYQEGGIDYTPSATGSSQTWIAVAFEIKSIFRRIIHSN